MFFIKKYLIIIAILMACLVNFKSKNDNEVVIPDDSIRFRIISNSNSKIDMASKLKLKKIVENYLFDLLSNVKSKTEANDLIVNNMNNINNIINKELNNNNYKISYGKNYFPSKTFKGVIYNEGYYDSLVITLGNGNGNNWWCVLFPQLCFLEDNTNTNNVEYKMYVSRIIKDLK